MILEELRSYGKALRKQDREIYEQLLKLPFKHRDWKLLAVVVGKNQGMLVWGNWTIRMPFIDLMKRLVERRIMFEFKKGIMLPI